MNINRNNYETFFLLYVDNELSAAERKVVELFVVANPDLKNELEQLQGLVLPADETVFMNKTDLLKTAVTEEKLLLHLDNELNSDETAEIEKALLSSPALNAEFQILQQTKLDKGDKIIFADKRSLYRKERDNVVAGRFVRWAAAAVLVGVGLFAGISVISKKTTENDVAVNKTVNSNSNTTAITTTKKQADNNTVLQVLSPDKNDQVAQQIPAGTRKNKAEASSAENVGKGTIAKNNAKQDRTVSLPEPQNNNKKTDMPDMANVVPDASDKKDNVEKNNRDLAVVAPEKKSVIIDEPVTALQKNSIASAASLTDESTNDRILYMNEQTVARSKVGGIFKKFKNAVAKTSNIKIGKSIKIANFEIALN